MNPPLFITVKYEESKLFWWHSLKHTLCFLSAGNLWEELREDSLVTEPQVRTNSPATFVPQDHHIQSSCLHVTQPAGSRCKAEYEDGGAGQHLEQYGCLNGLHPVVYSGVESLAGYLTSCTTSVSLM